QGRHRSPGRLAEDPLDVGAVHLGHQPPMSADVPPSANGRTSTRPWQAWDASAAQRSASSRSADSMIQKPPTDSFASANGPSVTMLSPSMLFTTVAVVGGCRPPPKTKAPASSIL